MNMPTANTNKSNPEEEKVSSSTTTEAITPDEKTPVEHDVDKNDNTSANELSFDSKKWIIALFVTLAAATLFGLFRGTSIKCLAGHGRSASYCDYSA